MKKIIMCFLFAVCCLTVQTQTTQDIGKIMLGVKIVNNSTVETKHVALQLRSRLSQVATQTGYSSSGSSLFSIIPNVVVNHVDVAEGGMKSIYVVQGVLTLSIENSAEGTVYSSTILPFKGSGTDKNKAIVNGILKIGYHNVKEIYEEARIKILGYYTSKSQTIFAKADSYAFNEQYDEAISCLLLIPEELFDLHTKAMTKAIEIYDKRNKVIAHKRDVQLAKENDAVLKRAQSYLSMQRAEEALKALWDYRDGSDAQNAQYSGMIAKAGALVSEERKRILAAEHQRYIDARMREDREWSMRVQAVEHEKSLENREMVMRENESGHKLQMENKRFEHQTKIENRQMDYKFANLEASTQTEEQKINAVKSIACDFINNNPNFLKHLK